MHEFSTSLYKTGGWKTVIIIGADIVPTKSNLEQFMEGDLSEVIDYKLIDYLSGADFRIFNLETPLTDISDPIEKNGPNLMAPVSCAIGLKSLNIDLVSLGNNHIKDQNEEGIISTIQALDNVQISHVGAGKDISEAQKPFYTYVSGKKIGIYSCTEHEFSTADEQHWGANPFDIIESFDHVSRMKEECDYAIVLYHGGKEHYRYPSPALQKVCRKFIEKGANLVICQHSHCIGCEEDYCDGKIVYGQGNFLFDYRKDECWQTSILIEITDNFKVEYVPIIMHNSVVGLAIDKEKEDILKNFLLRSDEIKDEGFVRKRYKDLARECLQTYIYELDGKRRTFIYKCFNKALCGTLDKKRYNRFLKESRVKLLNYIECETHMELLTEGLKGCVEKKEKNL